MSDIGKRRVLVIACCLNNLHGWYESLQTFFNFLITEKQQQKKKQNSSQHHLIKYLKIFQKEG